MLHARLLRYVEAVARHGSIRKAAEALNVAPSAINRQILEYERDLGLALFDRLPRGLRLTSAGETILAYILQAQRDHDLMMSRLRDLQGLEGGKISIVTSAGLVSAVLPRLAAPFCRAHPKVELTVDVLLVEDLVEAVAQGEADLGLGFDLPPDPRLATLASTNQTLGAVMRPDHPLAEKPSVRLSDCVIYPLILPDPKLTIRLLLDVAFTEGRIEPRVVAASNSVDFIRQMVLRDAGISFLSATDVANEVAEGRLVHRPLRDGAVGGQTLRLVARNRGSLEPLQSTFSEIVKQTIALELAE